MVTSDTIWEMWVSNDTNKLLKIFWKSESRSMKEALNNGIAPNWGGWMMGEWKTRTTNTACAWSSHWPSICLECTRPRGQKNQISKVLYYAPCKHLKPMGVIPTGLITAGIYGSRSRLAYQPQESISRKVQEKWCRPSKQWAYQWDKCI